MKRCTNISRVNRDDADESFGEKEEDDLINNKYDSGDDLDLSTVLGQSRAPPDVCEVMRSPLNL